VCVCASRVGAVRFLSSEAIGAPLNDVRKWTRRLSEGLSSVRKERGDDSFISSDASVVP